MRFLSKITAKFGVLVVMVLLMGSGLRHGQRYIMQAAGMPAMPPGVETAQFSSEESDLMTTVFKSALRLFSGSANRNELASELSDKLYSGRAEAGSMSELGIELVKPGGGPSAPTGGAGTAKSAPGGNANSQTGASATPPPGAKSPTKQGASATGSPAERPANAVRTALLARVWERVKPYSVEMGLVPVVILGMVLVHRVRRRRSGEEDFMPPMVAMPSEAELDSYEMKHAVHSLGAEDFESLVALIYQRQGYRVSMPAGLSGGRGGDFTLARKSERVLVQCKKLNLDHRVPVERVRELHEAMTAVGAPRGMYVASCGFTWDARNFAKAKGVTLINARTLDELLTAARETPDEDLLTVSTWVSKLMSKVKLTPPLCPACEATMDQINARDGSVWVCSQRPDCRGRRCARKHGKPVPTATPATDIFAHGPAERTQNSDLATARAATPSPDSHGAVRAPVPARSSDSGNKDQASQPAVREVPAARFERSRSSKLVSPPPATQAPRART